MNVKRTLLYLTFAILLVGCEPIQFELNEPFELSFAGVALNQPNQIEVQFSKIIEDSRCPSDVVCVWAGQVTLGFNLVYQGSEKPIALTLGQEKDQASHIFGDTGEFMLTLLKVDPYPNTTLGPIQETDYRATVIVQGGPMPLSCNKIYAPVCGVVSSMLACITKPCDDFGVYKTFGNACEAKMASATIAFSGECGELEGKPVAPVACTLEYAPVCAIMQTLVQCFSEPCDPLLTYLTYDNTCMADADQAKIAFQGECGKLEGTSPP